MSALVDGTQAVAAAYAYDPFGVLVRKAGTLDQRYQFSTKEYDAEIGVIYYGYRFYAPSIAKWTTRDPKEEAGGVNLYGFVGENPVNWVDPKGLNPVAGAIGGTAICGPACGVAGAIVGGVVGGAIGQWVWDHWFANDAEESGYKECKRPGKNKPLDVGKDISDEEAAERGGSGGDVMAPSKEKAEELARRLGGGKEPIHDDPHGPAPNYRPHYHPAGRSPNTHIFY